MTKYGSTENFKPSVLTGNVTFAKRGRLYFMALSVIFVSLIVQSPLLASDEQLTALIGGTVIDGTGAAPLNDSVILIKGNRILEVGAANKIEVPDGSKQIDVAGKTILPGFIDLHNHVMYPALPMSDLGSTDLIRSRTAATSFHKRTESMSSLRALHFMTINMRAGITALRDTGATVESGSALMRARELGYTNAARLFSVGNVIRQTGGHGASFLPETGALGPWGFREAIRENFRAGFRHAKISPPYTREEVEAAVAEAKKLRMKITVHAYYLDDEDPPVLTRWAVEAGVDSVEHTGNPIPDNVLDMMAERDVGLVPTLTIFRLLIERGLWGAPHPHMPDLEEVVRKAHDRGIKIGVGTDFVGNWLDEMTPGAYFKEMKYLVEIGLTPMEVIVAATQNGAIILGMEEDLGTLEKGKYADLQVIDGDPLNSFDVLGRPELVMIDGETK